MREAKEWLNEIGETVFIDVFAGTVGITNHTSKPGGKTEEVVKKIQLDAWQAAMIKASEIALRYESVDYNAAHGIKDECLADGRIKTI